LGARGGDWGGGVGHVAGREAPRGDSLGRV
jgi:hypothetical protein